MSATDIAFADARRKNWTLHCAMPLTVFNRWDGGKGKKGKEVDGAMTEIGKEGGTCAWREEEARAAGTGKEDNVKTGSEGKTRREVAVWEAGRN
eukprot:2998799-Rhodomonas_salina.2